MKTFGIATLLFAVVVVCTHASDPKEYTLDISHNGFSVQGSVVLQEENDCSALNTGAVEISVEIAGASYVGSGSVKQECTDGAALWAVEASLDAPSGVPVPGTGVSVLDAAVSLNIPQNGSTDPWSGTFSGRVQDLFAGNSGSSSEIALSGSLSSDAGLEYLSGEVAISGSGLSFSGTATVIPNSGIVTADGTVSLTSSGISGHASVSFDSSSREFHLAASSVGSFAFASGQIQISNTDVVLSKKDGEGWTGAVSGNAQFFGGTSDVSIGFANGELNTAHVSTVFMMPSGLLSGGVSFDYVKSDAGCSESAGAFNGTLRLAGGDDLSFSGSLTFDSCTGVITVSGEVSSQWVAPGSLNLDNLMIAASSSGYINGDNSTSLSAQVWQGTISASVAGGDASVAVNFNTESDAANVETMLQYQSDDGKVSASVAVASDCTGTGIVVVTGVSPFPSCEFVVSFSKVCDGSSKAWELSGALSPEASQKSIDFHGISIPLPSFSVTLKSDNQSKKSVELSSTLFDKFDLSATFNVGPFSDFSLIGKKKSGVSASPSSFLSGLSSGSSPFGSIGAVSQGLFDDITSGFDLGEDTTAEFDLDNKRVLLRASGSVFGVSFEVLVAASKPGSSWTYALMLSSSGSVSGISGLPGLVEDMLLEALPERLYISLANVKLDLGDTVVPRGFTIAASLPADSPFLQTAKSLSPGALVSQIEDAEGSGGGLTLSASLVSATEMSFSLSLVGGVQLGSPNVVLQALSLSIVVSTTSLPELGFIVVLDLTMGDRVLTAGGLLGFGAAGLIIGVSFESDTPWKEPFGVKGVEMIFPFAFQFAISPAAIPTEFALTGAAKVASATGEITASISVTDPTKNAFYVAIDNLDLQDLLVELVDCTACTQGVVGVLTDLSVDSFEANFNPTPSDIVIQIANVEKTIKAGISLEIENLNLWNVIKVPEAVFELNSEGMYAALQVDKVNWGPITITSATDSSKGPSFELDLRSSSRSLTVDGKAAILGSSVSLILMMNDDLIYGHYILNFFDALTIDVELHNTGKPGQAGFSSSLQATISADIIGVLVDEATGFLTDLADDADRKLEDAQEVLRDAQEAFDTANRKLGEAEEKATKAINDAQSEVNKAQRKVDNFDCGNIIIISDGCNAGKKLVSKALDAAKGALSAARETASALISLAQEAVDIASNTLDFANSLLEFAQGVVQVFSDIVEAIGSALKGVLKINELEFQSALSNSDVAVSFKGDITLFGQRMRNLGFNVRLNFRSLANQFLNLVRNEFFNNHGGDKVMDAPPSQIGTASGEEPLETVQQIAQAVVTRKERLDRIVNYELDEARQECDNMASQCETVSGPFGNVIRQLCKQQVKEKCDDLISDLEMEQFFAETLVDTATFLLQRKLTQPPEQYIAAVTALETAEDKCFKLPNPACAVSKLFSNRPCTRIEYCPVKILEAVKKQAEKDLQANTDDFLLVMANAIYNETTLQETMTNKKNQLDNARAACNSAPIFQRVLCSANLVVYTIEHAVAQANYNAARSARKLIVSIFTDVLDLIATSTRESDVLLLNTIRPKVQNYGATLEAEISELSSSIAKLNTCNTFVCTIKKVSLQVQRTLKQQQIQKNIPALLLSYIQPHW